MDSEIGKPLFKYGSTMSPRIFLQAEWRYLLMINYEIDPQILLRRVPKGVELDFWEGRCFVSLVGFRFLNTRVKGCWIPFHTNFDEINLRFYVRRETPQGWRRGVVFIKEIVPRRAIALIARRVYNEPYVAHRMRSEILLPLESNLGIIEYQWKSSGRWYSLKAAMSGAAKMSEENSQETFITEHYWGYTSQRDGSTKEYQVEHPRWKLWNAENAVVDCDVGSFYGAEFAASLSQNPSSAFIAEGSEICVHQGIGIE
jgi:uncharacterized protein